MKLLGCVGLIVMVAAMTFALWLAEGYAIHKLWGWFISPTFEIRTPGIWTSVGIAMLVGFLTNHQWAESFKNELKNDDTSSESSVKSIAVIGVSFLRIAFVLLCGWIVHCIGG